MSSYALSRSPFRKFLMPVLAATFLGYFGFHAFHGSYGIFAREAFDVQAATLEAELADLKEQTETYERRASLLRPLTLDPDMIDERARRNLNVIGPNDVVVMP